MDTENNVLLPTCPACKKKDRVGLVSDLAEKEDETALRLVPPDEPSLPPPLVSMNEGLGCVGALFFGAAFFLSVAYGSTTAGIIFGVFMLFFAAAFTLTIWRGMKARRKLQQEEAIWLRKMEIWSNIYYCARDDLVFDPQSGKTAMADDLDEIFGH